MESRPGQNGLKSHSARSWRRGELIRYGNIIFEELESLVLFDEESNMIDEKITVNKIDDHYHIQIGCQETIVHDKKEALKWLGKLWDEHIKEE